MKRQLIMIQIQLIIILRKRTVQQQMVNTCSYWITENLLYVDGRNVLRIKLNIKKPAAEEAKVFFLKKKFSAIFTFYALHLFSLLHQSLL